LRVPLAYDRPKRCAVLASLARVAGTRTPTPLLVLLVVRVTVVGGSLRLDDLSSSLPLAMSPTLRRSASSLVSQQALVYSGTGNGKGPRHTGTPVRRASRATCYCQHPASESAPKCTPLAHACQCGVHTTSLLMRAHTLALAGGYTALPLASAPISTGTRAYMISSSASPAAAGGGGGFSPARAAMT
jgi:hypothetical protein